MLKMARAERRSPCDVQLLCAPVESYPSSISVRKCSTQVKQFSRKRRAREALFPIRTGCSLGAYWTVGRSGSLHRAKTLLEPVPDVFIWCLLDIVAPNLRLIGALEFDQIMSAKERPSKLGFEAGVD